MVPAFLVAWLPAALAVATPLLVLAVLWLRGGSPGWRGPDDDSDSDSGDGPGGSKRRPPRPTLPTGPVSWPEFERQFAAYVERGRCQEAGTAPSDEAAPASDPGGIRR